MKVMKYKYFPRDGILIGPHISLFTCYSLQIALTNPSLQNDDRVAFSLRYTLHIHVCWESQDVAAQTPCHFSTKVPNCYSSNGQSLHAIALH